MSNAIRFTDMSTGTREIEVTLSAALTPPADESCLPPPLQGQSERPHESGSTVYIYMSVKDSGPGLQQEDLALLFQR
jgi:signal transduction histidine kinase